MLQKPLFKLFIYFMATFFFFLATVVIISMFKPGPSEAETMKFMSGFMGAMDKSIMGLLMNIEHESGLKSIIVFSATMLMPIIIISIIIGFIIRLMPRGKKNV